MTIHKSTWVIFLIGAGLTFIAAGLSPLLLVNAQDELPAGEPATTQESSTTVDAAQATLEAVYQIGESPQITGDNSYCLVCHNQPWHTVTLGDGSIQNLYVNANTLAASVHGTSNAEGALGCVDCHGSDSFPHDQPTPADGRAVTLASVQICATCHSQEAQDLESGLHEQAIRDGNTQAAVCTDCHDAHNVQRVVEEPELIAGVCGDCHTNTLVEWRESPHVDIGPLGCATCHAPHTQRLLAGNTSDELCLNCHENSAEELLVHAQHLESTSEVTCIDCHMYTGGEQIENISAVPISTIPTVTGHSMQMDTKPCTACHDNLVASGEWARLVAARDTVEVEVTPEPTSVLLAGEHDEAEEVLAASTQGSYIQLLQGLILGLGFGVTFAVVFITRGNRPQIIKQHVSPVVEVPTPPSEPLPFTEPPLPNVEPGITDSDDQTQVTDEQGGT